MSLELNAKETALVLIDLQNGIVGRQLAPYSGKDVVSKGSHLANAVREAGGTVVYVHVLVNEVLPLQADKAMPRPSEPYPPEASELVEAAGYQDDKDVLITKRQWDAFYATNLDQALRRRGVKTIVLGGVATNFGVESTARSAQARGYDIVFAEDAMTTMSAEMHKFAVEVLFPIIGRVRTSDEVMQALGAAEKPTASEPVAVVDGEQGAYN
jgi:nicotinamidase-related amidase